MKFLILFALFQFSIHINQAFAGISVPLEKISISPGETIHFYFQNGSPKIQSLVENLSHYWFNHINLKAKFHNKSAPYRMWSNGGYTVLVNFHISCEEKLGSAHLPVRYNKLGFKRYAEMDLCLFSHNNKVNPLEVAKRRGQNPDDNAEYKLRTFIHTVLHEFGHILGLKHEHLHPAAGVDYEECKRGYSGLHKLECEKDYISQDFLLDFNPYSVMHYMHIGKSLYGYETEWLSPLSRGDIEIVQYIYGPNPLFPNSTFGESLVAQNELVVKDLLSKFPGLYFVSKPDSEKKFVIIEGEIIDQLPTPLIYQFDDNSEFGCNGEPYHLLGDRSSETKEKVWKEYGDQTLSEKGRRYLKQNLDRTLIKILPKCFDKAKTNSFITSMIANSVRVPLKLIDFK